MDRLHMPCDDLWLRRRVVKDCVAAVTLTSLLRATQCTSVHARAPPLLLMLQQHANAAVSCPALETEVCASCLTEC